MDKDKSGAGYGNHGGDETYQDKKTNEAGDQTRDVPDDSGTGGYDDKDEAKPGT